ncbi:hypothetical protein Tco_0051867 [Tanacetum coccineum]
MVTHAFNIKNSMSKLVQKLQDHKKAKDHKMMKRDYAWLTILRSSKSHSYQVKDTSQSLKSMITASIHKLKTTSSRLKSKHSMLGDIFKIVSTAVCSRTFRESFFAGTIGIMTVEGVCHDVVMHLTVGCGSCYGSSHDE